LEIRVVREMLDGATTLTERIQRPVQIPGQLDGIMTGIRQLRRTRPLKTEIVQQLRVPTLPEMVRIKAWRLATRHTVRDHLDTVVLFERLGEDGVARALRELDAIYEQPTGASVVAEVAERLGAGEPSDRASVDLRTFKGIPPPWDDDDDEPSGRRRSLQRMLGKNPAR
jgi:hypothetical protein